MTNYDPETAPLASDWLESMEEERVAAVAAYHQRQRIRLPNPTLHAMIHTVVENQLAMEEQVVVETLQRLQSEGLTRHEAIHAIGAVLAELMHSVMKGKDEPGVDPNDLYFSRLKLLTAAQWRISGHRAV